MAKKNNKEETTKKAPKHLFGSSDKTDFILNMDFDGAQKMCSVFCIAAMAIVALVAVPTYFTQTVEIYTVGEYTHYLSENFLFYTGAMLMLMGWLGFLAFRVACMKGLVGLKNNRLLLLTLGVMLLALISVLHGTNKHDTILGFLGRHEGLLTICACYGLFLTASAVTEEKRRNYICDTVVILGTINSITAFLQVMPGTRLYMHNMFDRLLVRLGTDFDITKGEYHYTEAANGLTGIYINGYAASGFTTSPHALAGLLSLGFALALAGVAFGEGKKRRILYIPAAVAMAAAAVTTRTIPALLGICTGAAAVLVLALIKAFKKNGARSALLVLIPIAISAALVAVMANMNRFSFKDEEIIFTDGFIFRSTTMYGRMNTHPSKTIYGCLAYEGEFMMSEYPIFGIGPDNGGNYLSYHVLTADRFYNEYIDTAVQRGIPSLILWGVFLLVTVIKGIKAAIGFMKGKNSFIGAAALAAALAYLAQAWFNTTWVGSTHIFYIIIGLIWSYGILPDGKAKTKK